VISDIPQLRIINQTLWDAVRIKQGALKTKNTHTPIWDRRRPRTLFSGLIKCGCCGGGFSKVSQTQFGCSTARNKGIQFCDNKLTIAQRELEDLVLSALQNNLMDQDMLEVFCKEYAKERNRLNAEAEHGRGSLEKELATAIRDHTKLVDAIIAGIPAEQVKDKMQSLTERRATLEAELGRAPDVDPIRIHPNMASTYQERVRSLIYQLSQPDGLQEAQEALRSLVDRIVLQPSAETCKLNVVLEGALSGLLALALKDNARNAKASPKREGSKSIDELVLVAGVGFEPTTFRL
jgi:site-specific DNA recombinase